MWYYIQNNNKVGPVEEQEVSTLIENGTISHETKVWKNGMQDWVVAETSELACHFESLPPKIPTDPTPPPYTPTATIKMPKTFNELWLWMTWLLGVGNVLTFVFLLTGILPLAIGIVPLIIGMVIALKLLYRFWNIIQDGEARTTPGKAVGFIFIPIFNWYWGFVAYLGLAKDINAYCVKRNIEGPRVNENLAIGYCVVSIAAIIPSVGIVISVAGAVLSILLFKQFAETATRILATKK